MGLFDFLFKKKSAGDKRAPAGSKARSSPGDSPPAPARRQAPTPIPLPASPPHTPAAAEQWTPPADAPVDADTSAIHPNPIAQAVAAAASAAPTELPSGAGMDSMAPLEPAVSAEQACGIDPDTMDRDTIRKHLAVLYRRYNAAAASLDAGLRAESETMLDHIVACREKYVEPAA